ncbi:recombinase family protein [Mesorhizobium sp. M0998]
MFDKFRELQTARRVMRYLRTHDLRVPVRPLRGPAPHELVWRDATIAHVHYILHNPAYAGAYVCGRRRINAVRQGPGSHRAISKVAIDDWEVCIKDAHPGILTGRSSWPIRDASPTTPIDTRPATAARHARALLCCRA